MARNTRLPSQCVIFLIQQNTCPAVATLQATEESWGALAVLQAASGPMADRQGRSPGVEPGHVPCLCTFHLS